MHKVGDVVRLNRGWTPMIVLHITANNELYAVYASRNSNHYTVTERHYKEWHNSYSYHRHVSEFQSWKGAPICTKRNFIMTNRYKSTVNPSISGVYLNTSSRGDIIIEDNEGVVHVLCSGEAVRDIPWTFKAVNVNNKSHVDHFQSPPGVTIEKNDLLLSSDNRLYVVKDLNTECERNRGVFQGHRVVKTEL